MNEKTIYICTACHKIVPLFQYIIESVMCQTYTNWVWSICDNNKLGSTELENEFNVFFNNHPEYNNKRKQVVINYVAPNDIICAGKYKNMSVLLSGATNDELCIEFDSDDYLAPKCLEHLYNASEKYPQCDMFVSNNTGLYYKTDINWFQCEYFTPNEDKNKPLSFIQYAKEELEDAVIPCCDITGFNNYGWYNNYFTLKLTYPTSCMPHMRAFKLKALKDNGMYLTYNENNPFDDLVFTRMSIYNNVCVINEICYWYIHYNSSDGKSLNYSYDNSIYKDGYPPFPSEEWNKLQEDIKRDFDLTDDELENVRIYPKFYKEDKGS